ncbi:hypothetical protein CMV14_14800 [Rhizorhabdus dicambivorans]|nr:hypothetical protein CMV14_14800 [Rhizorhabdus dicambivorans]
MASAGGDGGRDAELYSFDEAPRVMVQYSVQKDWRAKIRDTLDRLGETFPDVTALVFLSSQEIGAQGDELTKRLREKGISLDIRDRGWFLDRMQLDDQRRDAATAIARAVVDPILAERGVINASSPLVGQEAKTALVFLELQARDEDTAKGLTKACFESLVRAALQGSDDKQKVPRGEIHRRIQAFLPRHSPQQLAHFIDGALERMSKRILKRHPNDQYHLSFEEAERTKDRLAGLALLGDAFVSDISDISEEYHKGDSTKCEQIAALVRRGIEVYLYRLGEEFAQSVASDAEIPLHHDQLKNAILEVAPKGVSLPKESWVDYLYRVTLSVLATPSANTTELFRALSTGYTLFAFLEEVPDVQKVTKKLFSNATFWLDTSVLLPLIAEYACPADERPFTNMMIQLGRSGQTAVITRGILEEVERHLSRCRMYVSKRQEWEGRVPYVYQRYILAGKRPDKFSSWLENFMGDHRPVDDLADFFADLAKIGEAEPLSTEDLDANVVQEVKEYWHNAQERRRADSASPINSFRLAEHDIENYLSVLVQRKNTRAQSALGYRSWIVSLDSAAWNLFDQLSNEAKKKIGHSPVISIDFLLRSLHFGPRRDQVSAADGYMRIFQATMFEGVSTELISAAEHIRAACGSLPERQIQRRIRDGLDKQRMRQGEVQRGGLNAAHGQSFF